MEIERVRKRAEIATLLARISLSIGTTFEELADEAGLMALELSLIKDGFIKTFYNGKEYLHISMPTSCGHFERHCLYEVSESPIPSDTFMTYANCNLHFDYKMTALRWLAGAYI